MSPARAASILLRRIDFLERKLATTTPETENKASFAKAEVAALKVAIAALMAVKQA